MSTDSSRIGKVIVSHSSEVILRTEDGSLCCCKIRKMKQRPVCGDQVHYSPDDRLVTAVIDRTNQLIRPDANRKIKPLAANIDQLVVVIAPEPEPDFYLVDRYLVAASVIQCRALILLNKSDLLPTEAPSPLKDRLALYQALGYPCEAISTFESDCRTHLISLMGNGTSILVGQSGTGKSSLIKHLVPDAELRIGAISESTGVGCHTTTATTLYTLDSNSSLIDSPGVRAFRLWNISFNELENGFKEISPLLGTCRYHNCRHHHEPDCAIKRAVETGNISEIRYQSFRLIADSLLA
jgi:ribosome biogenesis GTPase